MTAHLSRPRARFDGREIPVVGVRISTVEADGSGDDLYDGFVRAVDAIRHFVVTLEGVVEMSRDTATAWRQICGEYATHLARRRAIGVLGIPESDIRSIDFERGIVRLWNRRKVPLW